MHFQDLGWVARKAVTAGAHVRFVTWREYCETIAAKPAKPWRFTQENIRVTLPWGEKDLHRLSREVRSAENKLLVAEKMAAMANVLRGLPFPAELLRQAWDNVLLSQHHDAWLCANLGQGRRKWAWRIGSWTLEAENICDQIIKGCADALAGGAGPTVRKPLGAQLARVFNTVGTSRVEGGSNVTRTLLGNWFNFLKPRPEPVPNVLHANSQRLATQALDHFRELGELDLQLNHAEK